MHILPLAGKEKINQAISYEPLASKTSFLPNANANAAKIDNWRMLDTKSASFVVSRGDMHKIELSSIVVARIVERRGSLHPFAAIDPRRTAHVVVDLQNGFMAPGAVSEIANAREIVPNVNRISATLRAAGGLVVYIQNTFDETAVATWPSFFNYFCTPDRRGRMIEAFTPGHIQHEIWPGLEVLPSDLKVRKRRFGAFVGGSSELHEILRARGIDTIIVTGTATNVCCESTARDAMMLDYKVFFIADANATHTDAEHNTTLTAMANIFADVSTTEEVVTLIEVADVTTAASRQAVE